MGGSNREGEGKETHGQGIVKAKNFWENHIELDTVEAFHNTYTYDLSEISK